MVTLTDPYCSVDIINLYNNHERYYYTSWVPVRLPPTVGAQSAPVRHLSSLHTPQGATTAQSGFVTC